MRVTPTVIQDITCGYPPNNIIRTRAPSSNKNCCKHRAVISNRTIPPLYKARTKKGTATHSSILARRIPWTEEPSELQSMGSQRVRHDWATNTLVQSCCDNSLCIIKKTVATRLEFNPETKARGIHALFCLFQRCTILFASPPNKGGQGRKSWWCHVLTGIYLEPA